MTTTLQAHGGGAQPASIDTSGKVAGGVALRAYGFDSVEAAQAAGYVCEGGPAMSVALITDAQIAAGDWKAEGDPASLVIYTAPDGMPVEGGYALPVYSVNGWGSSVPAPIAPLFDSAEVGTVNASTVAVTFDQGVNAAGNDYSSGVTIKVNGSTRPFESGIRQSNHAIVYYALSLAVVYGDVVTWEYAETSGNIVSEDDSTPLADVTAQSVTNNVADPIGDALRADAVAYWKMDESSGTRSDATGNGNNLSVISGTSQATGRVDKSLSIDSFTTDYIGFADPQQHLSFGSETRAYAFWLYVTEFTTKFADRAIIAKSDFEEVNWEYSISINKQSDEPEGAVTNFYAWASFVGTANLDVQTLILLNQWYFIIYEYDQEGGVLRLSINNGTFGSTPLIEGDEKVTGPFYIGYNKGSTHKFRIDEFLVLNRVTTQTERDYLYNSGAGRTLYP